MQTIIKINQKKIGKDRVNSVLASELYKKLEIKEDFSKWIENKIKNVNFIENIDYLTFIKNLNSKYQVKEYILTLDSAKHIAMISESTKSFEIRNYFIEIEKKYQKKLLKNSKKCKSLLKSEQNKNMDLFTKLQNCQNKLNSCEKDKNFIKEGCSLKCREVELEVLKVINQFKSTELMAKYRGMPTNKDCEYIDTLLTSLKLYFKAFIFN